MSNSTTATPKLYALLIGIDHYLRNRTAEGSYPSLGGCVRDIGLVETFLRDSLKLPDERIVKLLARDTGGKQPEGSAETWPTYENMVAAFKKIANLAQAGDQVYIHYSGHGGRAKTIFPKLKGERGLDEALVPTDIGNPKTRYLRDVEMAHILQTMVDKGLMVTIVLDSCHSGGSTRGGTRGGAAVRGIGRPDHTPRPADSLVATEQELVATWQKVSGGNTRSVKVGSGWLLEPQGYVLFAACRASEFAHEYDVESKLRHGALTYWFLDSLKQLGLGPNTSYKMVHDRIIAEVHSLFEDQTPQLQGAKDRVVFGSEPLQPQYAVNVMAVDLGQKKLRLNTGQVQAVREGAVFAIYPPGHTDFSRPDQSLALVSISELGSTDSWADITKLTNADKIVAGSQAVLLDPGLKLQRKVRLVPQALPANIDQDKALKAVESTLARDASRFALLATGDEPVEFQVAANDQAEYEIWDQAGNLIKNLRPPIAINAPNAATRLVKRLIHLTKYRNVRQLGNYDVNSPLKGKLKVELTGKQRDYDPVDPPTPQPFADPGNTPVLKMGEWTFLRVQNKSSQVLNMTVLDLQPDWGIEQIFPSGAAAFEPLDPEQEIVLPLKTSLPEQYESGTDVIKVLATVGATDFRALALPSLDQPPRPIPKGPVLRGGAPRAASPLDDLLAAITSDQPAKRHVAAGTNPTREWVTAQVELSVERK